MYLFHIIIWELKPSIQINRDKHWNSIKNLWKFWQNIMGKKNNFTLNSTSLSKICLKKWTKELTMQILIEG